MSEAWTLAAGNPRLTAASTTLKQALILLRLERSGQITRLRREVFATNEIGPKGMAVGGQIVQQPPETDGWLERVLLHSGGCCSHSQRNRPKRLGSRRSWKGWRTSGKVVRR